VIIWLNGPFGVGKSTTTALLLAGDPSLLSFDPETIGHLLQPVLNERRPVSDFQDWPAWRSLTVQTLIALHEELAMDLVVPQTVVVREYWDDIAAGLVARGLPLLGLTLDVAPDEHDRRIAHDAAEPGAAGWRRARRADYDGAKAWLSAATIMVDTTSSSPSDVVAVIRAAIAAARSDQSR